MADPIIVNAARGGQPDFKGWKCEGQWQEYGPAYSVPRMPDTPPFNSHADAAYGQGYLNLHYPLIPDLAGTTGHVHMRKALAQLKKVGDVFLTNWIPNRAYLDSVYVEATRYDANLAGLYLKLVSYYVKWDFTEEKFVYSKNTAIEMGEGLGASFPLIPLGKQEVVSGLHKVAPYGFARFSYSDDKVPSTLMHDIVKYDEETGKPTGGLDANFGNAMLGFQVVSKDGGTEATEEATDEKVKLISSSNIAVYLSAKLLAFEGSTQIG